MQHRGHIILGCSPPTIAAGTSPPPLYLQHAWHFLTCSRETTPLPGTSVTCPPAALLASRCCRAAGEVPASICSNCAMTPATNGTACEVPVRSLQGRHVAKGAPGS